jgi:biopolymer transport protein ExbD
MPETCLSLWPTDACEWSIADIWHWSDLVQCSIYVGLALMLGYTFFVLVRFLRRFYLSRHELRDFRTEAGTDLRSRQKLIADLSQGLAALKAIASAAPFLGLAGTCYGIIGGAFIGFNMEKHTAMSMLMINIAASLATAAAGILAASPAAFSHDFIRTRVEGLRTERTVAGGISDEFDIRTRSVRFAQRLPLRKRFCNLPPFALIAAPGLGSIVCLFLTFEPYITPTGLRVALTSTSCDHGPVQLAPDRMLVLRIASSGELFINMEPLPWSELSDRLAANYGTLASRELYLHVEDEVSFQTVADAIDIVRNSPAPGPDSLDIEVILVTPNAARECVPMPVRVIPVEPAFR